MALGSKLDLSKYNDISDFAFKNADYGTDSEAEDFPDSKVELPSEYDGKPKGTKVAVRLEELGPRMTLELVKVQEGLFKGNVVYHRYIHKTKQEIMQLVSNSKVKNVKESKIKQKEDEKAERKMKRVNPEELDVSKPKELEKPKKKKVKFSEFE